MLRLRVKAPFAAFRTFTAGSYRPTAPFITPSAAYGLVLNIAGMDSRLDDGRAPMTLTRLGLPKVQIALGAIAFPEVQSIYQQLHNYPVGTTGQEHAKSCKGSKYNIQPVRREFLSGLDAYICLRGNPELEEQVRAGLREGGQWAPDGRFRYGLPFLGDNNFMIDVLKEDISPGLAYWYRRVTREDDGLSDYRCRLSVWICRDDMSQTQALLYAPLKTPVAEIPESAWTALEPSAQVVARKKKNKRENRN